MAPSAWDLVVEVREFFRAHENNGLVLCKCDGCAAKAGNTPVYERRPSLQKKTCSKHMSDQLKAQSGGRGRGRGRPRKHNRQGDMLVEHQVAASFYTVKEIVAAKAADLEAAAKTANDTAAIKAAPVAIAMCAEEASMTTQLAT